MGRTRQEEPLKDEETILEEEEETTLDPEESEESEVEESEEPEEGAEEEEEEAEDEESDEEDEDEEDEEDEEEEVEPYSPDEVKHTEFDKLDPKRIPPELVPWYKSMEASYTKKMQRLAEERKAGGAHDEMQRPDRRAVALAIGAQAKAAVEAEFGEPFDPLSEEHLAHYNLIFGDINSKIQQVEAGNRELTQKVNYYRERDPNFEDIDAFAKTEYENVPNGRAKKIEAALAAGDSRPLMEYWEEQRRRWYQMKGTKLPDEGKKTPRGNPPTSLDRKSGKEPPRKGDEKGARRGDASQLRGLNESEQAEWIKKNLL